MSVVFDIRQGAACVSGRVRPTCGWMSDDRSASGQVARHRTHPRANAARLFGRTDQDGHDRSTTILSTTIASLVPDDSPTPRA